MFKAILAVLLFAMIFALLTAARHLWREDGAKTLHWLWWRVGLAVALISVMVLGVVTGQLEMNAPWAGAY
jgi:hypothetical protein